MMMLLIRRAPPHFLLAGGNIRRRYHHSFAPPVFNHHVECIERAGWHARWPLENDSSKARAMNVALETASMQSSLQGLQKVVGIPADLAKQLLRQFENCDDSESWDDWKRRLLTWEKVRRGKDVFLPGVGNFNIPKIYEKRARQLYNQFAEDVLFAAYAAPLKKSYKATRRKILNTPAPRSEKIDAIRDWLVSCPEADLIAIFGSNVDDLDAILKKHIFCLRQTPPFPLFVHYSKIGIFEYKKTLDREHFLKCLYSGAHTSVTLDTSTFRETITTTPFWLVPVHELQALGHFSKALDGNPYEETRLYLHLCHILKSPDDDPFKQHLIRHSDYWNDPDNIGSIDELTGYESCDWPDGRDDMEPRQLLNCLREAEELRALGPNVEYEYLKDLPDKGSLRVLRSSHQVALVASKLKNCASVFAGSVERKELVLVVLEDTSGKPIALGSLRIPPIGRTLSEFAWEEIREASNRRPSDETRKEFYEYSGTLLEWHRSVFMPERRTNLEEFFGKLFSPGRNIDGTTYEFEMSICETSNDVIVNEAPSLLRPGRSGVAAAAPTERAIK